MNRERWIAPTDLSPRLEDFCGVDPDGLVVSVPLTVADEVRETLETNALDDWAERRCSACVAWNEEHPDGGAGDTTMHPVWADLVCDLSPSEEDNLALQPGEPKTQYKLVVHGVVAAHCECDERAGRDAHLNPDDYDYILEQAIPDLTERKFDLANQDLVVFARGLHPYTFSSS